ncbi:MAG: zinc ribbon domain-containing protein [Clostridia bacterium]|nr:zinc ribbon domain-containing protein [Clostridia bacterium]
MKCNKCNSNIPNDSEFCPICGNKIDKIKEEKKTISISFNKIIIGILGLLILIVIISSILFIKIKSNNSNEVDSINSNQNVKEQDSQYSINRNKIYEEYKIILDMYNKEAEENNLQNPDSIETMDVQYGLVDIDNDNIEELIIFTGTYNVDYQYIFYTFKDNKAMRIGKVNASTSILYKMNNGNYLKQVIMNMRI